MGLTALTKNPMASQNFCIEQLRGLDGSSPQFIDRDYISNLPAQDVVRLVEYLDGVRTPVSTWISLFKVDLDSRYPRSCQFCFPGTPACTQADMRCSENTTGVLYATERSVDDQFPPCCLWSCR